MRIFYVTHTRFPTERAHGWQIAKMCEAFASLGHEVGLVVPDRRTSITETPRAYYALGRDIPVTRLPVIDALAWRLLPRLPAFLASAWSFRCAVRRWLRTVPADAVLLTRDHALVRTLGSRGHRVVFEAHDVPRSFLARHREISALAALIVTTNRWKQEAMRRSWGAALRAHIVSLPHGVDLSPFRSLPDARAARRRLGLPEHGRLAVYTGHLFAWKGVYVLADASASLPEDLRVLLLGGTEADRRALQRHLDARRLTRVMLRPHVPPAEVPLHLAAADCLVLPNSGKDWNSAYTTSPLKLFEYLAARRPVVASDLPSIRELVGDREVRFVPPDDPAALAAGIAAAAAGDDARVAAGWAAVQERTWEARAAEILDALEYGKGV